MQRRKLTFTRLDKNDNHPFSMPFYYNKKGKKKNKFWLLNYIIFYVYIYIIFNNMNI